VARPLPSDWRRWLLENRQRGCALGPLYDSARRQGFDPAAISEALGGYRPDDAPAPGPAAPPDRHDPSLFWRAMAAAPLTDPAHRPRAWRLDTPLAQLYEIPALLSAADCRTLMRLIDGSLIPSTVTRGPSDYRTSRTCHLRRADDALVERIDALLAALIGVPAALSEPLQGQRYDPGQYFRPHTDWFAPGTEEFREHTCPGGQRTWTVMIYLNTVPRGGETRFETIGRSFVPVAGSALAWNNLLPDGSPNPATLHEALPVLQGRKYVITKWFRSEAGRNVPPPRG
jgi:prolyl 4-hydroxylase